MNTQYRKNLKAVLEASKNYVDKSIDNLKWELGTYDLDVESDNTTALVKTMPSGTIMANVNKIKGASVKYNQLVNVVSNVSLELRGLTITSNNAQKITLNGTTDAEGGRLSWETIIDKQVSLTSGHKYFIYISNSLTNMNFFFNPTGSETLINLPAETQIYQATVNGVYTNGFNFNIIGTAYNNVSFYLKIIDLTDIFGAGNEPSDVATTITLLKANGYKLDGTDPYSTGSIRNLELTSVDVEGQNILPISNKAQTTQDGVTYKIENNTITFISGTKGNSGNINLETELNLVLKAETYTLNLFNNTFNFNNVGGFYMGATQWASTIRYEGVTGSVNITLTEDTTINFVRFYFNAGTTFNNVKFKVMMVYGGTAPTDFVPYVQPTTIPIDLTSIEDSGGNKLFADGKLREGDYITPNKAYKDKNFVDLGANDTSVALYSAGVFIVDLPDIKVPTTYESNVYLVCYLYSNIGTSGIRDFTDNSPNMSMAKRINQTQVMIKNTNYATVEAFKTGMNGVMLEFDLADPIEANIDFSFLKNIQGYSNGSITAQNTYDMAVANEIDYLIEEVKA